MIVELSKDINVLFDKNLTWENYSLMGVRLTDPIEIIPLDKIEGTSMEGFPEGAESMTYTQGKVFYKIAGQSHEYFLEDRIRNVYEKGGWVHLNGGARFRIVNRKVVELRIDDNLLSEVRNIPLRDIEHRFGKADSKVVWEEPVDCLYTTTTFIYLSRQLRVTYEDYDRTIDGINIGETLIDEYKMLEGVTPKNDIVPTLPVVRRKWWQKFFGAR